MTKEEQKTFRMLLMNVIRFMNFAKKQMNCEFVCRIAIENDPVYQKVLVELGKLEGGAMAVRQLEQEAK